MTSEKWRTTWELYSSARDLPAGERSVLLDSLGTDPEILQEVLALLDEPEEQAPASAATESVLPSGSSIDRYVMLKVLGKGGAGEVYSARDRQLDRIVALKFLKSVAIGARSAGRLIREAKTLSSLNHPNIVTVYEVIQARAGVAIAMELVEGVALRSMCGEPLPSDQIVRLGQQIAQALATAHAHGIVHRDIKPENILVRPDGYVKVVDFGLAGQVSESDPNGTHSLTVGTLRYMSPEQMRGGHVSAASDIFALGLVLYELATGRHPFAAGSSVETAHAIATKLPAPLGRASAGLPSRLEQLILAMLSKSPAARPSAAAIALELGEIHTSVPLPAVPEEGRSRFWLAIGAAALVAACVAIWFAFTWHRDAMEFSDLRIQPLTSQAGWEQSPALSPDGQSVAFTWSDKLDGQRQIYLKKLSEDDPVQLTSGDSEGPIGSLAWSPDGKRIAFKRANKVYQDRGAIYSIPSTGGKPEKIVELVQPDLSTGIDWSPDGTELAFSDRMPGAQRLAIYLFRPRSKEKQKLTSPPAEDWGDWDPKFSPDGATVAFKRVSGFWFDDIYLVPATGGAPRRFTSGRRGIWGHTWTSDGKSLIVSCQRTGSLFGIWRLPLASHAQPERISLGEIDAVSPTTGRKTNRLAWVSQLWDLNVYRASMKGSGRPTRLIASTVRDGSASYAPDGHIAFVSDRSGSREIWLAKADGSGQVRVTSLNGPPIDHLRWSPDGQQLAFDSRLQGRPGIFVLRCDPVSMRCAEPRRMASEDFAASAPSWSADGKFLYFASDRANQWQLWKQPVNGGPARQLARAGGYASYESLDGRWLYFANNKDEAIFRIPVSESAQVGSRPQLVIGPPYHLQPDGWTITRDEVVFIDRARGSAPAEIRAYNPETKAIRSILSLNELFLDRTDIGLSVSPDAKWILYSQLDRSGSNVMVAENRGEMQE